jgi:hypothetical protein
VARTTRQSHNEFWPDDRIDRSIVSGGKKVIEVIGVVESVAVGFVDASSAFFHAAPILADQNPFVGMSLSPIVPVAKGLMSLVSSTTVLGAAVTGAGRIKLAMAIGAFLLVRLSCG